MTARIPTAIRRYHAPETPAELSITVGDLTLDPAGRRAERVQIDIVPKPGQNAILIPRNVEAAINFFQSKGPLRGRTQVVAEDPERTEIIGNFHMTYEGHNLDCRNYPWFARTFNKPHHEIENDARVGAKLHWSLIRDSPR